MRLIKRETTVPIPEVYSFNTSTHNNLGCPFILMEYIEAVPLHEIWFEESSSTAVIEPRQAQILQDLAAAVVNSHIARAVGYFSTTMAIRRALEP